jgi:Zn-dependent peptidase ImmA (M78 family)
MSRPIARSLLERFWNGYLPVDPFVIARGLGIEIGEDPDLGEAYGRYERMDGRSSIRLNQGADERLRRITVAHQIGHHVLEHGDYFLVGREQFDEVPRTVRGLMAGRFALELLVPGFMVEVVIMKRNVCDPRDIARIFAVPEVALVQRLRRLGWAPQRDVWEDEWNRARNAWDRQVRRLEAIERRLTRMAENG